MTERISNPLKLGLRIKYVFQVPINIVVIYGKRAKVIRGISALLVASGVRLNDIAVVGPLVDATLVRNRPCRTHEWGGHRHRKAFVRFNAYVLACIHRQGLQGFAIVQPHKIGGARLV